ncbi:MAG: L-glutamate gamma-semialdehyde dehydrogenase [Candidatus Dormibacteraeota bacterium]|nr:L-glutamate gamma-semialdehyde dehydrogenase [Candidatus Dormibacteraeota bacterium]
MSSQALFQPPVPRNEPVHDYAPGSPERTRLEARLRSMGGEVAELPMVIGGKEVRTSQTLPVVAPHDTHHVLGHAHQGGAREMEAAIETASGAQPAWAAMPWEERAAVFLRAADLLSGPWRDTVNAATMLGQSKTAYQAEIDAAAELCDFFRFNAAYLPRILEDQPLSPAGTWNRMEYRPLEGFVLAVTPFNFTSIAGNLPSAPALLGNTVVWKPSQLASLSAHYVMELLRAAGLPDGVINLVQGPPAELVQAAVADSRLAGIHFTGSTTVFQGIWSQVAENLPRYRNYPRLVGETGGKDFIVAHASAELQPLATAILRGAFEYQGQKCSAPSRLFIPRSLWPALSERLRDELPSVKMGDVADLSTFMGAVIDERAFTRHREAIAEARDSAAYEVVAGGGTDDSKGWFVEPTVIRSDDPTSRLMREELFGPIVTAYVYPDAEYEGTLEVVDSSTPYGLTGAVFARDRAAITVAGDRLRYAAGNFYINDKPTGAVVGQQPFGGARASGTNDKAGSVWNLIRWVSPRAIKESFVPPEDYRYPSMG